MVEETSLDYANYLRQIDFTKEVISLRLITVHNFDIYNCFLADWSNLYEYRWNPNTYGRIRIIDFHGMRYF